jgi:hypothetical protein
MKNAGRITTLLGLLLSIYLLGYWLLIKKEWAYLLVGDASGRIASFRVYKTVKDVFKPLTELEHYLSYVVPMRNRLTGHWSSATTSDFVRFDSNQEYRFQLGEFASTGKAEYDDLLNQGFIMEFRHQGKLYLFYLRDLSLTDPFAISTPDFSSDGQENAFIGRITDITQPAITDYKATLIKQAALTRAP